MKLFHKSNVTSLPPLPPLSPQRFDVTRPRRQYVSRGRFSTTIFHQGFLWSIVTYPDSRSAAYRRNFADRARFTTRRKLTTRNPPPPLLPLSPSCLITGVRLYCHGSSFTRLHLYPTLPPTLRSVVDYRIMRDHLLSRFTGWPNAVESNEDRDRASRSAKRIKIRDRENYINIFDYIYLRSKIYRIDRIE